MNVFKCACELQVLEDVVRILSENTDNVNTVSQLEMAVEAVTAIQNTLSYPGLLSQVSVLTWGRMNEQF